MKFIATILLCVTLCYGCVTTTQTTTVATPDCTGSVYAGNKALVDTALNGFVLSSHVLALYDPAAYTALHTAAGQVATALEGGMVTNLSQIGITGKASMVLSLLLTLWSPEQLLHQCDRDMIMKYLKMV